MNLKKPFAKANRFLRSAILPKLRLPILAGRLRLKKWVLHSGTPSYWLGSYEYPKKLLFERTVKKGSVVFDIGAHVGFYTLLAADLVGPQGRVYAFEPFPRNLRYLREHLRINGITNATVINAAVSNSCGVTQFQKGITSTKGHIAPNGGLRVMTVSLDKLISIGRVPIPHYMKIDVEGSELLVLAGAEATLGRTHPTLFLSTHAQDIHQQCLHFLDSLGYKLRPVIGTSLQRTDEVLAYLSEQ